MEPLDTEKEFWLVLLGSLYASTCNVCVQHLFTSHTGGQICLMHITCVTKNWQCRKAGFYQPCVKAAIYGSTTFTPATGSVQMSKMITQFVGMQHPD